eukprot:820570-Rhodomonas_salina.1
MTDPAYAATRSAVLSRICCYAECSMSRICCYAECSTESDMLLCGVAVSDTGCGVAAAKQVRPPPMPSTRSPRGALRDVLVLECRRGYAQSGTEVRRGLYQESIWDVFEQGDMSAVHIPYPPTPDSLSCHARPTRFPLPPYCILLSASLSPYAIRAAGLSYTANARQHGGTGLGLALVKVKPVTSYAGPTPTPLCPTQPALSPTPALPHLRYTLRNLRYPLRRPRYPLRVLCSHLLRSPYQY